MAIKRLVDTSFWTDGKVDEFTPEDKYFMLYLLTNPFTTQLGIYELSIKQAAFQMGYSVEAVQALIERFENKYSVIIFSKETSEIAIKNFLRHSIVKGGKPVEDCIRKEMLKVKNRSLIDAVFNHIADKSDLNQTVKKIVNEIINNNDNNNEFDNDNDNDNDNERIVPRFVDESSAETKIIDLFHSLCPSFLKVEVLSEDMKADLAESLTKYTEEQFKAVFEKAEKSSFLKGKGKNKWKASFYWLIKAENIAKVLNGNFDDNEEKGKSSGASYDLEAFTRMSREKEPVYAKDSPKVQARADALKQQLTEGSV